jgi:hypothetical protein
MSRAGFTRRLEALEGNVGSRQSALVRVPKPKGCTVAMALLTQLALSKRNSC